MVPEDQVVGEEEQVRSRFVDTLEYKHLHMKLGMLVVEVVVVAVHNNLVNILVHMMMGNQGDSLLLVSL